MMTEIISQAVEQIVKGAVEKMSFQTTVENSYWEM